MFDELFKDIKDTISTVRHGAPTRTLTVAKPYCTPARSIITGALNPYGVKVHSINEHCKLVSLRDFARRMKVELRTHENLKYGAAAPGFLPSAWVAQVTVNESAAAWAEYLLLRTGLLYVPGQYVNRRNEQWAEKHGGAMPPQWNNEQPWIELSCKGGVTAWTAARQAIKDAQRGKGPR